MDDIDRKQRDNAERTGRTAEVTGEVSGGARTFEDAGTKDADKGGRSPHDLTGPAGDPAEGKRPGGDTYPA